MVKEFKIDHKYLGKSILFQKYQIWDIKKSNIDILKSVFVISNCYELKEFKYKKFLGIK